MSLHQLGDSHPRCSVAGYPDGPGRALHTCCPPAALRRVREIAWKAKTRLCGRFRSLMHKGNLRGHRHHGDCPQAIGLQPGDQARGHGSTGATAGIAAVPPFPPSALDAAKQNKKKQNHNDKSKATRRVVTPPAAVWPSRECAQKN